MAVVLIEKQTPQITVVTLNRPERRNALTIELLTELQAAIKVASEQPHQRVLILRGAGAAFCTGLDLKEAADHTKAHSTAEMVANTLIAISQTRLITIAAVHGAAVAGGAGIMSACDFVVAAQRTKVGYPEVRRGLVAGLVMTFLRRQVGERNMRELLLGSELISAERAKEIGLVNEVLPAKEYWEQVLLYAKQFCPPHKASKAVGLIKRSVQSGAEVPFESGLAIERELQQQLFQSEDAKEGIAANQEKRVAEFKGR